MPERFELKQLSKDAIERANERAQHYRLLNAPEQAESICLDVLAIDEGNEQARVTLILALTDQFGQHGGSQGFRRAMEHVAKLSGDYERAYYAGVVAERQGRAYLTHSGMRRDFAYEELVEAMRHYERAEGLKPAGVGDAVLRWNSCVRTIQRHRLQPRREEPELPLE